MKNEIKYIVTSWLPTEEQFDTLEKAKGGVESYKKYSKRKDIRMFKVKRELEEIKIKT